MLRFHLVQIQKFPITRSNLARIACVPVRCTAMRARYRFMRATRLRTTQDLHDAAMHGSSDVGTMNESGRIHVQIRDRTELSMECLQHHQLKINACRAAKPRSIAHTDTETKSRHNVESKSRSVKQTNASKRGLMELESSTRQRSVDVVWGNTTSDNGRRMCWRVERCREARVRREDV